MADSMRIGGIHVDLGLSTAQFQKGVTKAKREAAGLGNSLKSSLAGIARNFGVGLLAGVGGITGIAAGLRQVASSVAEIRNEAARAGVTTRVFQEWAAVAAKARIPMDALTDAFKELNIRGDEFAQTAKGSAAEAFQRLGLTPAEGKEKLKAPAELMLLLIERARQLKDTAAATRVFDELFGGTGAERLVALLGQSTDEIRATIDQAHTLGNVLDDEVIAAAAEVDKQFAQIVHTVGQNLRGAIVSAYTALQDFISAFNGFDAQRSARLDEHLAALGQERLDVEREIIRLRERQAAGAGAGDGILGTSLGESTIGEAMADQQRRLEAIQAEEAAILKVVEARRKAAEPPASTGTGWTPAPYTPPSTGKSTRERADDYERLTLRITEAIAAQVAETEAQRQLNPLVEDYGLAATKARTERELLTAAEKAGKTVTPALRAEIAALAEQYALAGAEAAKLAEEHGKAVEDMNFRKDLWLGVAKDFRAALADGKIEMQELGDIAISVLDRITPDVFTLEIFR